MALGRDVTLSELRQRYDAVFLGFGLSGVNGLGVEGETLQGVANAVDYIADLRQAPDRSSLPVGRRVVVIGGGMTAIDIAVQSKALGADEVTLVYRRGPGADEREPLRTGVRTDPRRDGAAVVAAAQIPRGRRDACAAWNSSRPACPAKTFLLEADMVFKAIGQKVLWDGLADTAQLLQLEGERIAVDEQRRTSLPGVWAGGDCVQGGEDLTVSAVQDGKLAALSIDRFLREK